MVASLNMILVHVAEHFELKMDEVVRVALECPAFKARDAAARSQKTTKSGVKKEPREPVPPLEEWMERFSADDVADLTKEELKVLLKEAGQRVGGKKAELASRFEGYLRGDIQTGVSTHSAKKSNDPIDLTDCTTTEELEELSAKALRTMCMEYGLAKSGKKPVLVTRLMDFAAAGPNENASERSEADADDADADADSVFDVDVSAYPKAGAEREQDQDPEPVLEDVTDESELDGFRAPALKEYLRETGLRTSGKKDELKARVWRALCEESTPEDYPKKRGRSPGPGASPRANENENKNENESEDADAAEHIIE